MPLVARQAAVEEQLAAMENQCIEQDDTRPYEDAEQAKRFAARSSEKANADSVASSWTVDVAATESDREVALHMEIEDLVSQLNFSAFAIDPFSVEQIAIDYQRSGTPSKQPQAFRCRCCDRVRGDGYWVVDGRRILLRGERYLDPRTQIRSNPSGCTQAETPSCAGEAGLRTPFRLPRGSRVHQLGHA